MSRTRFKVSSVDSPATVSNPSSSQRCCDEMLGRDPTELVSCRSELQTLSPLFAGAPPGDFSIVPKSGMHRLFAARDAVLAEIQEKKRFVDAVYGLYQSLLCIDFLSGLVAVHRSLCNPLGVSFACLALCTGRLPALVKENHMRQPQYSGISARLSCARRYGR